MPDDAPPLARAKALALRSLASRMRTEAQLRARLDKAELGAHADEVVAWLLRLGYLDDSAYAKARARALVAPGRLGPRLAELRLRREGVAAAAAREAIARAVEDQGGAAGEGAPAPRGDAPEVALCRALAERRARGQDLAALDPRGRRRLARFLLGRGFAGPIVSRVLGIYEDG